MNSAYLSSIGIPFSSPVYNLKCPEDDLKNQGSTAATSSSGKAAAVPKEKPSPKAAPKAGAAQGKAAAAPPASGEKKSFGFLQEQIDTDLAPGGRCADRVGRKGDVIRTRFPPEPNGYLHIGHAKSIFINFSLAEKYDGRCHLRFDDTNPAAEEQEYVDSIKEDVKWLGFDWGDHLYFASDYFDQMWDWAIHLVKTGHAYVDSQSGEEMRKNRGNVTTPGTNSKYRDRSVAENMKLFQEMRDGKHKEGTHVLRMKGDMTSSNMNMRDMPIYRILHKHHHNTGNKWCVYPLYDFAHGEEDAIEGITHSICTLEFEAHRELYEWFHAHLPIPNPPKQFEFARLNLTNFVTSKRKLRMLVESGICDGWDDPRMSTLSGLRRRGVTSEAIKAFCGKIGVTKMNSTTDVALLEDCIRDDLDSKVHRKMVVLDPIKVIIEDYPKDKVEEVEALNHPQHPEMGSRKLKFSREVYIERDDFREDAPDSYFRLKPGGEVKLRYSYVIKFKEMKKNKAGEITELVCTHDPATRDELPKDRKVKGVIHWVSVKHAATAKVRLYEYVLKEGAVPAEEPAEGEEDEEAESDAKKKAFLKDVNPNSLVEPKEPKLEESLAKAKPMERFQFERNGFFCVDKYSKGQPIFNRIIGLVESGLKKAEGDSASRSRKEEQAKQAADKEAKSKIDPKEMFKSQTDLYSKFDDDGIPTHDAQGEPIAKSKYKKLKQEWDKQAKLFAKK